ncbi:hypothetical protein B0H11DRAFT_1951633 [Mycena galericulata]|nr:hypothetical protein B0H11DRAFT_1951633 [Mycena galericulata]
MSSPAPPSEPLSVRIFTSNVHNQLQSPLFSTLYPELRNIVFRYALTEYDDPLCPYSKHAYYYRPGFQFAGKIDTNLLLTCRVVYLETHLLPVSLNEHVFWQHRGPTSDDHFVSNHDGYFARMTPQQRAAVRRVRFFTQLYWLEGRGKQTWPTGLCIPKLAITIRHTDWWFWESGEDLHIQEPNHQWGQWIGSIPRLAELELEFESIEEKREQLEQRVQVALGWTFPLEDGAGSLVHDGAKPANSMWLGTSRMAPQAPHQGWGSEDEVDDEEEEEEEEDSEEEQEDDDEEEEELENAQNLDDPLANSEDPATFELKEDTPGETEGSLGTRAGEETRTGKEEVVDPEPSSRWEILSPEARLDLRHPLDLTLHVRKFKFVNETRLL